MHGRQKPQGDAGCVECDHVPTSAAGGQARSGQGTHVGAPNLARSLKSARVPLAPGPVANDQAFPLGAAHHECDSDPPLAPDELERLAAVFLLLLQWDEAEKRETEGSDDRKD